MSTTAAPLAPGIPAACQVWLGRGVVRHARLRPVQHAFAYPTWFVLLPMRAAPGAAPIAPWALARNRRAWVSFHDADHGDGRSDCLAWLMQTLSDAGVEDAHGAVWLHTLPRVFGLVFKPVSFWYALRADGGLAAIVAEVNNTFGERHCYVLPAPRWGRVQEAQKVFHVSPFNPIDGHYRFRFFTGPTDAPGAAFRTVARIELADAEGLRLSTSVSGVLEPLTPASLRRALWAVPWLSLGVMVRIHTQALQLWRKRVPFFRKPMPPAQAVSLAWAVAPGRSTASGDPDPLPPSPPLLSSELRPPHARHPA